MRRFLPLFLILLTACSPKTPSVDAPPKQFSIYIAPAIEDWIPQIYDCATRTPSGLVSRTPNIGADIAIRLIAPKNTEASIYQIGEIELVIVSNPKNPVPALNREQVLAIYEGKIRDWAEVGGESAQIQLWVYGQDAEIQLLFNQKLLRSKKLSTLARQAQSQAEMRREIAKDKNALGIISRTQADKTLQILYSIEILPVFAISKESPTGDIFSVLSCLQEN